MKLSTTLRPLAALALALLPLATPRANADLTLQECGTSFPEPRRVAAGTQILLGTYPSQAALDAARIALSQDPTPMYMAATEYFKKVLFADVVCKTYFCLSTSTNPYDQCLVAIFQPDGTPGFQMNLNSVANPDGTFSLYLVVANAITLTYNCTPCND